MSTHHFGSLHFTPEQLQMLFGQGSAMPIPTAAWGNYGNSFIGNAYDPTQNPVNNNNRYYVQGGKVYDVFTGQPVSTSPDMMGPSWNFSVIPGSKK